MTPPRQVPDWDTYFLTMCAVVSTRSKDPATQHGAVLVDEDHRIIGTGYNGGCRYIEDTALDWGRPAKYEWGVIHAEENALWSADRRKLEGCTLYVTGPPCSRCMMRIAHSGIGKVVFGGVTSHCVDQQDWEMTTKLAQLANIVLEQKCDLKSPA